VGNAVDWVRANYCPRAIETEARRGTRWLAQGPAAPLARKPNNASPSTRTNFDRHAAYVVLAFVAGG